MRVGAERDLLAQCRGSFSVGASETEYGYSRCCIDNDDGDPDAHCYEEDRAYAGIDCAAQRAFCPVPSEDSCDVQQRAYRNRFLHQPQDACDLLAELGLSEAIKKGEHL